MVATRKREYQQQTASTLIRRATRGHVLEQHENSDNREPLILSKEHRGEPAETPAQKHGKSGRPVKRPRLPRRSTTEHDLTGYLSVLPIELLEKILALCNPTQLGQLESTCKYFRKGTLIENLAKDRLKAIPRAKDLVPDRRVRERWLTLLLFVTYQSTAAAQSTAVAFGAYHSAALLIPAKDEHITNRITHSVHTFGRGFHGQLGTAQYEQQNVPHNVSLGYKACLDKPDYEEEVMPAVVACGSNHTASISRRGELFTWGLASSGELGHNGWMPIEVNSPKQSFPICSVRIVSVATGGNHTLAISEYGGLFTCGRGRLGQLGHGSFHDEGNLIPVAALKQHRIVSSAAGKAHSMALAADGTLFTWGHGKSGQLGHPQLRSLVPIMAQHQIVVPSPQRVDQLAPTMLDSEKRVTAIAAAGNHSMVLTVNGKVLVFGSNKYGQLGLGDTEDRWSPTDVSLRNKGDKRSCVRAVQVVCGRNHSLALVCRDGTLQACSTGHNSWGQLGLGHTQDKHLFTVIPSLKDVSALQSGDEHCGAVTGNGSLFCWGRGDCGQLGLDDERSRWRPTLLPNFKVVHPDRTLRRHKRCTPNTRPILQNATNEQPKQQSCFFQL